MINRISHSCSCIIEFIKLVAKKEIKSSASLAFCLFSSTRLTNSIKHEHSCKLLYILLWNRHLWNSVRCENAFGYFNRFQHLGMSTDIWVMPVRVSPIYQPPLFSYALTLLIRLGFMRNNFPSDWKRLSRYSIDILIDLACAGCQGIIGWCWWILTNSTADFHVPTVDITMLGWPLRFSDGQRQSMSNAPTRLRYGEHQAF